MQKFGVIAGTPIDTAMGVAFMDQQGFETVSRHCSDTSEQQSDKQVLHKEELARLVVGHCRDMAAEGARGILLYCNSMAGAIDMDFVRENVAIPVVTPLDVFRSLAKRHSCVAALTANCQSLSAIEKLFRSENSGCMVYGAGIMPLVNAIESGEEPGEIVKRLKIDDLARSLCRMGGEIVLLACTHFPYIMPQIESACTLPVVDPARGMLELLLKACS